MQSDEEFSRSLGEGRADATKPPRPELTPTTDAQVGRSLLLVWVFNKNLPPYPEDFDPAAIADLILAELGDAALDFVEGVPLASWLRDSLEQNRRSRRGRRSYVTRLQNERVAATPGRITVRPRRPGVLRSQRFRGRGATSRAPQNGAARAMSVYQRSRHDGVDDASAPLAIPLIRSRVSCSTASRRSGASEFSETPISR